jgi:hypothetical protein
VILAAKIGWGLLGTALVVGGIASSEGFVHVSVQEHRPGGTHLWLVVPAIAAPVALRLVPRRQLEQALDEKVRGWLPVVQAATTGLEKCQDGSLVEVTGPSEHVNVAKRDGSLVVDVTDPQETVHVVVPLGAVGNSLSVLAERAGPL